MFPTSLEYQEVIKRRNRRFRLRIRINHSQGELILTEDDVDLGTVSYSESSQAGEAFTIGSVTASTFSFDIINKNGRFDHIDFMGATIVPSVELLIREGVGAYFLQPSQPSDFGESQDLWEGVPLGVFIIDDPKKYWDRIKIKSIDKMRNLLKPYKTNLSFPATLGQIYVDACNLCDVTVGSTNFLNFSYMVHEKPSENYTFRDVIRYVAEASGSFAKMNRYGALELGWYKPTGLTLTDQNWFNFYPAYEYTIKITGVLLEKDDKTLLVGTDEYAVDLTGNPLIQKGEINTLMSNIFNKVKDVEYRPYTSQWQGNPALQAGDMITIVDRDGKSYPTLVTNSVYKYGGKNHIDAKGLTPEAAKYKGSSDRAYTLIKQRVEGDLADQLSALEQAQLNATTLMANMLGGYVVEDEENGILYIADNPDIAKATKMWKWGINGFGYSSDGGKTWTTAVTADGSIVAELVSAGIISADFIVTGVLQSKDGSVHIDLDNNRVNLGGALIWDGSQLKIQSPDIPSDSLIKNPSVTGNKDGWYNQNLFEVVSQDFKGTPTSVFQNKSSGDAQMTSHEFKVDPAKAYQVTVWFKRNDTAGSTYLGLYAYGDASLPVTPVSRTGVASADSSNFYFWSTSNNAALGDWFKVTGYILPAGFNPADAKNLGTNINCIMKPTTKKLRLRWLNYYNSGTERTLWMANPQVIEISPDTIGRITDTNTDITDIKTLKPGTLKGGITTLTNERVRVEHGSGQYSEMRADGFFRKWPAGEGAYLNDVYAVTNAFADADRNGIYTSTINLPERFRGRSIEAFVIPKYWRTVTLNLIDRYGGVRLTCYRYRIFTEVQAIRTNVSPPQVDVYVGVEFDIDDVEAGRTFKDYRWIDFDLIIIGKD